MNKNKFMSPIGAEPVDTPQPQQPSVVAIRAVGRAALQQPTTPTEEQQRAWFGGVVFNGIVRYDEMADTFIANKKVYTPDDVYTAIRDGRVLN